MQAKDPGKLYMKGLDEVEWKNAGIVTGDGLEWSEKTPPLAYEDFVKLWEQINSRDTVHPDHAWLNTQLARHTYKPGWQFAIRAFDGISIIERTYSIAIRFKALDSRNPDNRVAEVAANTSIPSWLVEDRNEEAFTRVWEDAISRAEMHEVDEWRRRDGLVISDPHRNDPGFRPARPVSREAIERNAVRMTPTEREGDRDFDRWGYGPGDMVSLYGRI